MPLYIGYRLDQHCLKIETIRSNHLKNENKKLIITSKVKTQLLPLQQL